MNNIGHINEVPILMNHRLILKKIVPNDAKDIMEICVYDRLHTKNEETVVEYINNIEENFKHGDAIHWGIFLKDTNEILGTCSYYRGYDHNIGEVGYIIKPLYRHQGIMSEALKLIVDYGFNNLKLEEVIAYTYPSNIPSMSVLNKIGFKKAKNINDYVMFTKKNENSH